MTDRDSVINGLNEIMHYNGEQMFYNDIFIRGIADNTLALLKEQDEMISITTVAEYLADNAPPPLIVQHWESVMAWERFLLSLKGRKIRND